MSEKTSTGYRSTGNWSTGYRSTGNRSTGNWSTGNWSTGNWSVSNYSVGHFSTEDYSAYGSFNKPCSKEDWDNAIKPSFLYFNLTEWIESNDMTDEEKENNPTHINTGGYLKVYDYKYDYKEAWLKAWESATDEDKELLYKLPNFDAEVFKEISGIDVNEDSERNKKIKELEEQARYIAEELNKLK